MIPNNIQRYTPDYKEGLTGAQVEERVRNGLTNAPVKPPMKSRWDIVRDNIFTYFNMIFVVIAFLLCIVQSYKSLTFLPVIICNTIVGIVQEIRSKKVLDKMNMLNAPKAAVVRDGAGSVVPAEELVLDDIVIFEAGCQICADAYVVHGEVKVNESLLTGESDEILKKPGDKLMSGSFIVSGECYARLDAVGADSYISGLIVEAKSMDRKEQSEMIRSLNRLVKFVGIIIIPMGLILYGQSFFVNGNSFRDSIVSTMAALIGMIPEGLYLLATVALALSAMRLAQRHILLHDMKSIETLARVNVLCVDKTGTITENTMAVQEIIPLGNNDPHEMSLLAGDFANAMSADNITMCAVKDFFIEKSSRNAVRVYPFSSVCKYSGVVFDDGAYVLGAPEYVLGNSYDGYREKIAGPAGDGLRILALVKYDGEPDGKPLTDNITPLAFITLANPVRKDAPETFGYFASQNVAIKVISGDNPVTVSKAAKKAGIDGADRYVDAATLTCDNDMKKALTECTVFGRVTPEQKRAFVRILKDLGNTVAMTGDGVNDILALKDADCSVAMASGSEAAAQSAQVVLLDSDFAGMPEVVLEGRKTVNNIERSASLFLVKNIFSLLLALFSVVSAIKYPLHPTQVTLVSTFTIGIPGFFLALEPNYNVIKGRFIRNVLLRALPAGITDMAAVIAVVTAGERLSIPAGEVSTTATLVLSLVGIMVVAGISLPLNKYRMTIIAFCTLGIIFSSIFFHGLFVLKPLSQTAIIVLISVSAAATALFWILRWVFRCVTGMRKHNDKT